MRVEEGFQQGSFYEENPYTNDPVLPYLLRRLIIPSHAFTAIKADLSRFGERIFTEIRKISANASPPTLKQYDQWGGRVDELITCEAWRKLKMIAQSEGIVSIFYEREFGEYSRIHGFAKSLLLAGDGQVIGCPLSMTDGTARVIELSGTPSMKRDILPRLISRDPAIAMTSGQWMTERPGGSDVSQTETTANSSSGLAGQRGSTYILNGLKWFSSATDSELAVALARTGRLEDGTRSLSLFLVPTRLPLLRPQGAPAPPSTSNGILVHRLKEKIGTHILPTAELSLNNTEGYLISPLNQGVKAITPVLNITRLHSAIASIGYLRRCLSIAQSYSKVRAIHGGRTLLQDVPLHVAELAKINLIYRALTHLAFGTIHLLGKSECNVATSDEEKRLRLLTPVTKAFAAEKACTAMEECMACLGGQGYMEENAIGRLIRDGLVEKIWEGTISVLALDFFRAASDRSVLNAYIQWAKHVMNSCPSTINMTVKSQLEILQSSLTEVMSIFSTSNATSNAFTAARPLLMLFAHITAAINLLEQAIWSSEHFKSEYDIDILTFTRWVEEGGMLVILQDLRRKEYLRSSRKKEDVQLVYGLNGRAKL